MTGTKSRACSLAYVSGYRAGQPCPYAASEIVSLEYGLPFLVCGYHARAYGSSVRFDLNWSLAEKRRWQIGNLDALIGREPARTAGDPRVAEIAQVWVEYWTSQEATVRDQDRQDAALSLMVRQFRAALSEASSVREPGGEGES